MYEVIEKLRLFVSERDWDQFHSPRNLATALVVEAAELLEIFQWQTEGGEVPSNAQERVEEELADVMLYCMMLGDKCGIDLNAAMIAKIAVNELKYPTDKSFGRSKKYTEL